MRFGSVLDKDSLRSIAFKEKVDVVVSCLASRTGKRCGLSADTVSLGQTDQQCRRTIAYICMQARACNHACTQCFCCAGLDCAA